LRDAESNDKQGDLEESDVQDVDSAFNHQSATCLHQGSSTIPKENDDLQNRYSGVDYGDMYIPSAIADDSDARPPQARNGRLGIYICVLL
jgi:hypothetical protein